MADQLLSDKKCLVLLCNQLASVGYQVQNILKVVICKLNDGVPPESIWAKQLFIAKCDPAIVVRYRVSYNAEFVQIAM